MPADNTNTPTRVSKRNFIMAPTRGKDLRRGDQRRVAHGTGGKAHHASIVIFHNIRRLASKISCQVDRLTVYSTGGRPEGRFSTRGFEMVRTAFPI
jgi:hypothetical protein